MLCNLWSWVCSISEFYPSGIFVFILVISIKVQILGFNPTRLIDQNVLSVNLYMYLQKKEHI